MKNMKKILFMCLIALGMMFTSCGNQEVLNDLPEEEVYSPFNKFDSIIDLDVYRGRDGKGYASCEIFQTLYEKEGLAEMWWSYDVVYVVSETPIFDGMRITETETKRFKMIGTYTYYTVEDKRKVVPVIKLYTVEDKREVVPVINPVIKLFE